MSDDTNVAVVKPYYAIEEAYTNGYDRFHEADLPEDEEPTLDHFYGTAAHANIVLPNLRSMAGYDDTGPGTYTVDRKVAAIEPGCEEDDQAPAELVSASTVFDTLFQAWQLGAYDALNGDDRYESEHDLPQW